MRHGARHAKLEENVFWPNGVMVSSIEGTVVVISGGASGIGLGIARSALQYGASVTLADASGKSLKAAEAALADAAGRLLSLEIDVASEDGATTAVRKTVERFGTVNDLVNNAGIIRRASTEHTSLEEWTEILRVNLTGAFLLTRAAVPILKAQGSGNIVNISSRSAIRPHRNASPAYGASKAGLLYLTKHWAYELASYGIRVNAIAPGPVRTEMFETMDDKQQREALTGIPMQRAGTVQEIADVAMFLVSDAAAYLTGQTIHVNGGSLMP